MAPFSAVNYTKSGTIYLKASSGSLTTACSTAINVIPAAAVSLAFSTQPSSTATARMDGKALYERYGCVSCHGNYGVGIADLRKAGEHYPTRETLKLWIQEAQNIRPVTGMPSWKNVIREEDYDPLIDHVLKLGKNRS